jgi:prepilin-type N-terminal cleavage/methylation domain-containing protein
MKRRSKKEGFTIVELLVVTAIVALLSTIVIASLSSARTRSKVSTSRSNLRAIADAVFMATGDTGKSLYILTGRHWTGQYCVSYPGSVLDLRNSVGQCYTDWSSTVGVIVSAASSSYKLDPSKLLRDPWGSPYYLDENESTAFGCTQYDALVSPGPDGILNDPVNPSYPATTDDISIVVPFNVSCF